MPITCKNFFSSVHTMSCTLLLYCLQSASLSDTHAGYSSLFVAAFTCIYVAASKMIWFVLIILSCPKESYLKLILKTTTKNCETTQNWPISASRAAWIEIFKPKRVIEAHDTIVGTLYSTVFHSAIPAFESQSINTTLVFRQTWGRCKRTLQSWTQE